MASGKAPDWPSLIWQAPVTLGTIENIPGLLASLSNVYPVYPGMPITLTWQLTLFSPYLDITQVTASIYLGGDIIYGAPPVNVPVTPTTAWSAETGPQVVTIPSPVSQFVADALYQVGTKELRLVVTPTGVHKAPINPQWFSDFADLLVLAESIDEFNWGWTSPGAAPAGASVSAPLQEWKQDYTLAGRIIGVSRYSGISGLATLYEAEGGAASATARGTSPRFQVGRTSGATPPSEDLSFPPIIQSWQWMIPGIWLFKGPRSKGYAYRVRITMNDDYGNTNLVSSPYQFVAVRVSDLKIAAQVHGYLLMVAAASFAAAAAIPPWVHSIGFLAAAASLVATAAASGAIALDPPTPDPLYRSSIKRSAHVTFPEFSPSPEIRPLMKMLDTVATVLSARLDLYSIEGRLLGAQLAHAKAAAKKQLADYKRVQRELIHALDGFEDQVAAAVEAIEQSDVCAPELIEAGLRSWPHDGVPARIQETWLAQGLPQKTLGLLDQVIREPHMAQLALTPAAQLRAASTALYKLVYETNREAQTVTRRNSLPARRTTRPSLGRSEARRSGRRRG